MKENESWRTGITISVLLIAGMAGITQLFDRHELFFPELLAMAMGCFWMRNRPWHTTRLMMFFSLSVGGMLGVLLAQVPFLDVMGKMLLGYAICGIWLAMWRLNITPMLSACLLPLQIGQVTWLYPVVIMALMSLLCIVEYVGERLTGKTQNSLQPNSETFANRLLHWGQLTVVLTLLLLVTRQTCIYAAVPPLVVAFSAFADLNRPVRKHYWLGILVCTTAAALGVGGRYLVVFYSIPWALITAVLVLLFAYLCRKLAYFLPPSAAIMLLAFLIPEATLPQYLWQVPLGSVLFLGAGRLFSLWQEKRSYTLKAMKQTLLEF